jgi:hypothetical protein
MGPSAIRIAASAGAILAVSWSLRLDLSTVVPALGSEASPEAAAALSVGMQAGVALALSLWVSCIAPEALLWRTAEYDPTDERLGKLDLLLAVTGFSSGLVPVFPAIAWLIQRMLPGTHPTPADAHAVGAMLMTAADAGSATQWLLCTGALSLLCLVVFLVRALAELGSRNRLPFAEAPLSGTPGVGGREQDLAPRPGDHAQEAEAQPEL